MFSDGFFYFDPNLSEKGRLFAFNVLLFIVIIIIIGIIQENYFKVLSLFNDYSEFVSFCVPVFYNNNLYIYIVYMFF